MRGPPEASRHRRERAPPRAASRGGARCAVASPKDPLCRSTASGRRLPCPLARKPPARPFAPALAWTRVAGRSSRRRAPTRRPARQATTHNRRASFPRSCRLRSHSPLAAPLRRPPRAALVRGSSPAAAGGRQASSLRLSPPRAASLSRAHTLRRARPARSRRRTSPPPPAAVTTASPRRRTRPPRPRWPTEGLPRTAPRRPPPPTQPPATAAAWRTR